MVLERLQKDDRLSTIPVIVLTARDPRSSERRALQAGASVSSSEAGRQRGIAGSNSCDIAKDGDGKGPAFLSAAGRLGRARSARSIPPLAASGWGRMQRTPGLRRSLGGAGLHLDRPAIDSSPQNCRKETTAMAGQVPPFEHSNENGSARRYPRALFTVLHHGPSVKPGWSANDRGPQSRSWGWRFGCHCSWERGGGCDRCH